MASLVRSWWRTGAMALLTCNVVGCDTVFVRATHCDGEPLADGLGCGEGRLDEVSSCDDGSQNQGEHGVDCGGPCAACDGRVNPEILSDGDLHVAQIGSDATGTGSPENPWRTVAYALSQVPSGSARTVHVGEGLFVEAAPLVVPPKVSIVGAGAATVLKADPAFAHADPGAYPYPVAKMMMQLQSGSLTPGHQVIRDLAFDGDAKTIAGALLVNNRTHVLIDDVRVADFGMSGIWLWSVEDSRITDARCTNSAYANTLGAHGCINIYRLRRVEIDHVAVDEDLGNGIRATGGADSAAEKYMDELHVHDSTISVTPIAQWNGGASTNVALELGNVDLTGCEVYDNYFDGKLSIIAQEYAEWETRVGTPRIRVHHNVFDLETRGGGVGAAIDIAVSDIEIDHNYVVSGQYGITNWDAPDVGPLVDTFGNWSIHHNVFFGQEHSAAPTRLIYASGTLEDIDIFNNTIEPIGASSSFHLLTFASATANTGIHFANNLVINSLGAAPSGAPRVFMVEGGTTISASSFEHNLIDNGATTLDSTVPAGVTSSNNLAQDAQVQASGARPTPYYLPAAASALIDAGKDVGFAYSGVAPDIGAFEL